MIKKAKVKFLPVRTFKQAVSEVKEYSTHFQKGLDVLNELTNWMCEIEKYLESEISIMNSSKEQLFEKIKSIEKKVTKLTAKVNKLEERLSELEYDLSSIESYIKRTNINGETIEFPNPVYVRKEAEEADVEMELSDIRIELESEQNRLNKADLVYSQMESYISEVKSIIFSIQEKQCNTKRLTSQLLDSKNTNTRKCCSAIEGLNGIEKAIDNYLYARIKYENATAALNAKLSASGGLINININISKVKIPDLVVECPRVTYSNQEIKKHGIKFDDENKVCEFDGKSFGGAYNLFEVRIDQVPKDPIFGRYEGVRGESKFIPSDKIAEGISVIEILKSYGLDGITYYNAEPDFEPCAEAVVKISNMTENRYNYGFESKLGNFSQADIECAKIWNFEGKNGKKNWTPRNVASYRNANRLTWHEKCDMETMVLVRYEINAYFKHSGGCSECAKRDAVNNEGGFDES